MPTARSAATTEFTCVRTSMQYVSSSTMRCRPRTCPSIRRSRSCRSFLFIVYPRTATSCLAIPRRRRPSPGIARSGIEVDEVPGSARNRWRQPTEQK